MVHLIAKDGISDMNFIQYCRRNDIQNTSIFSLVNYYKNISDKQRNKGVFSFDYFII